MTIDVRLLEDTMALIEAHPEQHDQAHWFADMQSHDCETTFCFAGHAAILSGAQPPNDGQSWYVDPETGLAVLYGTDGAQHVMVYAQNKLGLTDVQADKLFHGANTVERLRALVNDYTLLASAEEEI